MIPTHTSRRTKTRVQSQQEIPPWFARPSGMRHAPHLHCAVIGAGISGCSVAYALARRKYCVQIFDRKGIASEASGNPVGVLQSALSSEASPPNVYINHAFGFTRQLILELKSQGMHISSDLGGIFRTSGVPSRHTPSSPDGVVHEKAQEVTAEPTSSRVGLHVPMDGTFLSDGGWIQPTEFCHALLQSPVARDWIRVISPCEVASMHPVSGGWELHDAQQQRLAWVDVVVLAHSVAAKMWPICAELPLFSVRGQLTYLPETPVTSNLRMVLSGQVYCTPSWQGIHIVGAGYERDDTTSELRSPDQSENLRKLQQDFPIFAENVEALGAQLSGRVGWRCVAENRLPLVGAMPDWSAYREHYAHAIRYVTPLDGLPPASYVPGLYVSLAHGSRGLTSAPLAGEMVACLISGEPLPLSASLYCAVHPARFWVRQQKRWL